MADKTPEEIALEIAARRERNRKAQAERDAIMRDEPKPAGSAIPGSANKSGDAGVTPAQAAAPAKMPIVDASPAVGNAKAQQLYKLLQTNDNYTRALNALKAAEGTSKYDDPYRVAFGGRRISDLSAHPEKLYSFRQTDGKVNQTSAHGAYQFLTKTWKGAQNALGLPDFSQKSQDIAALYLMQQRGSFPEIEKGDVSGWAYKNRNEWASLPASPYAQPTRSSNFVLSAWNGDLGGQKGNATWNGGAASGSSGSKAGGNTAIPAGARDTTPANAGVNASGQVMQMPTIYGNDTPASSESLAGGPSTFFTNLLNNSFANQSPTQLSMPMQLSPLPS